MDALLIWPPRLIWTALHCEWLYLAKYHQDVQVPGTSQSTLRWEQAHFCLDFTSYQYLRSYQDEYRSVNTYAQMENQAANTMTRYPTQSHYPDIEPNQALADSS